MPALLIANAGRAGGRVEFRSVGFWHEVFAGFLANMFAAVLITAFYVLVQWFLAATDVVFSYSWRFDGTMEDARNFRPAIRVVNRSRTRSYYLGNIRYDRLEEKDIRTNLWFDNKSIMGMELKPGKISYIEGGVVPYLNNVPLSHCVKLRLTVQLQTGRKFWLKGQGPGQQGMGRIQRRAFILRDWFDTRAFPLE